MSKHFQQPQRQQVIEQVRVASAPAVSVASIEYTRVILKVPLHLPRPIQGGTRDYWEFVVDEKLPDGVVISHLDHRYFIPLANIAALEYRGKN